MERCCSRGLLSLAVVPELCGVLTVFSPTSCAKLRSSNRSLAVAFGTEAVDRAARHEVVALVLNAPWSSQSAMLAARIALANPRLDEASVSNVLQRLRDWLPVVFPPANCEAQEAAISVGLPRVLVVSIRRHTNCIRIVDAICEILRRCCVHNPVGIRACLSAGAIEVTMDMLRFASVGTHAKIMSVVHAMLSLPSARLTFVESGAIQIIVDAVWRDVDSLPLGRGVGLNTLCLLANVSNTPSATSITFKHLEAIQKLYLQGRLTLENAKAALDDVSES